MSNPALLEAVPGDDPCGPDMRWDSEYLTMAQDFETLMNQDSTVSDAEFAAMDQLGFEDIVVTAESLCQKTKDVGILVIYAEACWHDQGLAAFADAMDDFFAVIEQWSDPDNGVYPRADPEDGHLGERAAPLGRLLARMPSLVATVGWGRNEPEASVRNDIARRMQALFQDWSTRLGTAFGSELPSKENAWSALSSLLGTVHVADDLSDEEAGDLPPGAASKSQASSADPWDLVERAAELMAQQERHSPAVQVLRLVATWRSRDLVEIMELMTATGMQLEQVLQSMKQQATLE